jgi:hypothetical protein
LCLELTGGQAYRYYVSDLDEDFVGGK